MKPEDLRNPDGLNSTQREEEKSSSPSANEQMKNETPAEQAGKGDENPVQGFSAENTDKTSEPEEGGQSQSGESDNPEHQDDTEAAGSTESQPGEEGNDAESAPAEEAGENVTPESNEPSGDEAEPDSAGTHEGTSENDDTSQKEESDTHAEEVQKDVPDEDPPANKQEPDEKIEGDTTSQETDSEQKVGATKVEPASEKAESKAGKAKSRETKEGDKQDYTSHSFIELINELTELLDNNGDHDIKDDMEAIKAAFYKKVSEEAEEQKKKFIEEGGNEEDFEEQENPYEQDMKELLKRYRQVRHDFNKKMEQEKDVNLQKKYEIIEDIKGLIHKEESINKTFNEFRELQQQWREIGPVPQAKMKDLWDTYHFHVENFYDYIKINQELRDLDLKKNLEVKIRLCEQAEELLLESNSIRAFNQLQKLHDRWREVGPVPRENKDDIWDRFKAATSKINKKYQEFFEQRKQEQKKNLEAKQALCEKVEEINEMELDSHKEWSEKSKEVVNLQKVWRTIGFAPRKDNNKIYSRFREACDKFFDAKRDFYSKNKELQQSNLQMKTELCLQAEALKDSTDWRKATQDLINIQKQWKEIGPVPRKQSDVLWKRFRAACDHFFDRKAEHFSEIDSEQVENLNRKMQLISEVENFKSTGNVDENLNQLKDFQRRWTEIGHVPIKKKDEVQKRFRESINALFDNLKIDDSKRNMLKFRTKIVSYSESSRGQNKMRLERDKYMTRLKQMENDLVLLDNNIGFFAKSKNAESLIEDVQRKIEQTREKIEFLKNKIRVIDEMDSSED